MIYTGFIAKNIILIFHVQIFRLMFWMRCNWTTIRAKVFSPVKKNSRMIKEVGYCAKYDMMFRI